MKKDTPFELIARYPPTGDQPQAIETLCASIERGEQYQTLLGVTGSGKTFTMAQVINRLQRPTLVLSHNKTLAAQLYSEFKLFFPKNAVEYFVSYYDYYQPEAYIPQTDTYIEKESQINDEIERLRLSTATALLSRRDVIVVASVSAIYSSGTAEDFLSVMIPLSVGETLTRERLMERLVENLYVRTDASPKRAQFRVRGDVVDVYPAYAQTGIRVEFFDDTLESLRVFDPETGALGSFLDKTIIYAANIYITPKTKLKKALAQIREELEMRVQQLQAENKLLEAQRLRMRTEYDLELLEEMGFCRGVENYSRHMDGRAPGARPHCIMDFFDKDFMVFLDESHVTLPQIGGMYAGDRARKERLVNYGFRLPSALDNRPLKDEEFQALCGQTLFVSATPAMRELTLSTTIAQQVIRPTGLLDPEITIKPTAAQVEDLMGEIQKTVQDGDRVLVTTLTKRMAEDITQHMREHRIKVEYLHSDIDAIERVEILRRLRRGLFDVLVGINLLREGLDLPEVALVAVLDADKEGFLRSETSLIQTVGRAARNARGRVVFYADKITQSIEKTLAVTQQRRSRQMAYNVEHGITPTTVHRQDQGALHLREEAAGGPAAPPGPTQGSPELIEALQKEMLEAAALLQFEKAAILREQIQRLS